MTEPLHIANFLTGDWRHCAFEYFREGVEICRLVRGEPNWRSCVTPRARACPSISIQDWKRSWCWRDRKATNMAITGQAL